MFDKEKTCAECGRELPKRHWETMGKKFCTGVCADIYVSKHYRWKGK